MATGSEILSYTGNAGLGLGANPGIDFNVGNLNQVNQAMRDVILMDADQNNRIYQQKLKDRDSLYALLANNQVQSGKILEKDRAAYDEAERRQQKAFNSIRSINDSKGLEDFYKASNDLRNYTNQAQARYLGVTELEKERASKLLPSQQEAYKRHIETQESKPFWDSIDPYQQALSLNLPSMYTIIGQGGMINGSGIQSPQTKTTDRITTTTKNGKTSVTESQTTSPVTGGRNAVSRGTIQQSGGVPTSPITTTSSFYDFDVYKRNANEAYLGNEEQQEYQNQWRHKWESLPQQTFIKNLELVNDRIREYNQDRDFLPNGAGYVPEIEYTIDPTTGRPMIAETTPDFAAKTALASVDGPYVSRSQQFDKDIAKYLQDEKQLGLDWYKAKTAREKANTYSKWISAKMQQPDAQSQIQVWNGIVDRVIPSGIVLSRNKQQIGTTDVVWADELPQGYQTVGGVGVNSKGKVVPLNLEPKKLNNGGRPYYDVIYYLDGQKVDKKSPTIVEAFNEYKNSGQLSSKATIDDFVQGLVKSGSLQLEIEGKNGRANAISAIEAQRALSNASVSSKQDENPYNSLPNDDE